MATQFDEESLLNQFMKKVKLDSDDQHLVEKRNAFSFELPHQTVINLPNV